MIKYLGMLAEITTGKLDANAAVENGEYPFFTCSSKPLQIDNYAFSCPAILVAGNGNVGNVIYYNGKFNAYQRTYVLTNFCDYVEPIYLLYYLKCYLNIYATTRSQGSIMPYITLPTLQNCPIPLPPMSEQYSIAHALSSMDDIISNNESLIKSCKFVINSIYDYWFVQFDFPDENGRPYKSSGGRMVYNKQLKQEIPEGWEVKRMIDLFDFERGTEVGSGQYTDNKLNDNYVKFYRVRDVGDDSSTWVSTNNDLRIVHPGDVVITLDGTVGKIGVDIDGAISGGLRHVVDHNKLISNGMIWAILQSYYVQESLRRYVSGRGSILAHAGGAINDLQTPYDKQTFINFQNIINPMFELMVVCSRESKLLASLRDWLLPMLMNGQVRINASKEQNNEN